MTSQAAGGRDIGAGLPVWAAAVAVRLEFFYENDHSDRLAALIGTLGSLRPLTADLESDARALARFMYACLDSLGEATRADNTFVAIRDELDALCGLARTALETDRDDRPLLARNQALTELPSAACWAAVNVPGRVVFLAAMVEHVPGEVGAAAVMLVNDLAAVDADLPLRALQAAAQA
jgi:hypothetical protein